MAFSWDEINDDWLVGSRLALANDEVVAAFNKVDGIFGRPWVEARRVVSGAVVRGTQPTLGVVTLGQFLTILGDAPNTDGLLTKVRDGDDSAWAELAAIYLICSGRPDLELEIEPTVIINGRERMPDCRVRHIDNGDWVYVETTQATPSDPQKSAIENLKRLASLVTQTRGSFGLEVLLEREPSDDEIEAVVAQILNRDAQTTETVDLEAGLGTLNWTVGDLDPVVIDNTHGQPHTRLGIAGAFIDEDEGVSRRIVARWPFMDPEQRARRTLGDEAEQLPTIAPGLVMIQAGAAGAMRTWPRLIRRRFQPTIHTRVSAVCLFSRGQHSTQGGAMWRPETKLLINPHATHTLPPWIQQQLERFPSNEPDL